ncbi:hypothetical protein [Yersinia intermedia]|uniref:hypothetical protein n=1 Tax=Yersinia intermedia TaxID=631 RepID=UPI0005DF1F5F|nr:hypothetical protein [Yersinia intermedia]MCB5311937.1 hypothetical protein [Yersinia intermedia]MCB5325338.1 hypothetical protein [Yersinia intermedia]CNH14823.1 Uncharacterised protein [Yersinia intermedia]CQD78090.1 Uncharacterised protein [Yersinia intermedia]
MKCLNYLLIPVVLSISGCSTFFPEPTQYIPPSDSADVAKIRLIGPPMSYALYQTDKSGKKGGGWVLKHNRYLNPFLGSTKGIGLPKVTGKEYTQDYFETLLVPEEKTTIHHSLYQGCSVNLPFTPEKKKIYEANISYGDKTGYCVLYLKEIVLDSINGVYVERGVSK